MKRVHQQNERSPQMRFHGPTVCMSVRLRDAAILTERVRAHPHLIHVRAEEVPVKALFWDVTLCSLTIISYISVTSVV